MILCKAYKSVIKGGYKTDIILFVETVIPISQNAPELQSLIPTKKQKQSGQAQDKNPTHIHALVCMIV